MQVLGTGQIDMLDGIKYVPFNPVTEEYVRNTEGNIPLFDSHIEALAWSICHPDYIATPFRLIQVRMWIERVISETSQESEHLLSRLREAS